MSDQDSNGRDPDSSHFRFEQGEEDAATFAQLQQLGEVPRPRVLFVNSLKEELMQAKPGDVSNSLPNGHPEVSPIRAAGKTLRRPYRPTVGWIAFAALLLLAAAGIAYMSFDDKNPGGNDGPSMAAVSTAGSEVPPSNQVNCGSPDPYFGCGRMARLVSGGFIFYPNFSPESLEVRQVQLQTWTMEPGASIAPQGEGTGAVVDFVLEGSYRATFDVPVVVTRAENANQSSNDYLDAGELIELTQGDTVSYELGGLVELRNPLETQQSMFMRAVVYEGDISAFSAISSGVTTRVEGETTLPTVLGSFSPAPIREVGFQLWYVQLVAGEPFPPARWTDATIIGPVRPLFGDFSEASGYVLVIRPPQG